LPRRICQSKFFVPGRFGTLIKFKIRTGAAQKRKPTDKLRKKGTTLAVNRIFHGVVEFSQAHFHGASMSDPFFDLFLAFLFLITWPWVFSDCAAQRISDFTASTRQIKTGWPQKYGQVSAQKI
jgi:hypothetical protein